MSRIDLHIHSNFSGDATYDVKDIMKMAKEKQMEIIAITDHNSVAGVREAVLLGKEAGIDVIPGIEIDTRIEGIDFHMLGYEIDIESEEYQELEEYCHQQAIKKSWQAVEKFIKYYSLDISKEVLEGLSVEGVIEPEDFANYLLKEESYTDAEFLLPYRKNGSRSDNPNVNVFWDYFSQGKVAYVKEERISYDRAIDLIHRTGGIAVIAHPGVNFKEKDDVLEKLLQKADGIEVFCSYHTEEQCEKYYKIAKKYDLKISCGSDFHGHNKPMVQIGKIPGKQIEDYINI